MGTYKFVLTGGPCGGKTESIDQFADKLTNQNYQVNITRETANSLLELGYVPGVNVSTFDFQNLIFKIQFLKEYIAECKSEVLLCDRGLFDGLAYIGEYEFKKILEFNKVKYEDVSSTYDGVLYFRSVAHEYPSMFRKKRIYETPEIGRIRDDRCRESWKEKVIPCRYYNIQGFEKKQKVLYEALLQRLSLLKNQIVNNLADYYDSNSFNYIYNSIEGLLNRNNIPNDIKQRTRGLIK